MLDYARSYLSGKWEENRVRFVVESRTRVLDESSGQWEDFYQCASCKSEDTFASRNLFYKENYDFLPIFGPRDGVIFRRTANLNPRYKEIKRSADMWAGQTYRIAEAPKPRVLDSNAAVRNATRTGMALVGRVEIANPRTRLRAWIEFPVKTMNIHDQRDLYQVDTGPVAFPDLSRRWDRWAECLSLAFVAFNTGDFADFVIEDETELRGGTKIHHYSRIVSLGSRNQLFAWT